MQSSKILGLARRLLLHHGWIACWCILTLVALSTRPLLPVDETRYVGVAWEMWTRGEFLVPHLNGTLYSHKPPLMFWAMDAGWWLFGVNAWWPRLIAPLLALATLFSTRRLARELWPERQELRSITPWVLAGGLFWSIFSTLVMFDLWEALFATTSALGLLIAARGRVSRGFALVALSIGLGILAKGPVILLYSLPPALLAPWWRRPELGPRHGRWYAGVALAVLLGAGIALAWALPAAAAGGEAYADAILWGQTTGRLAHSPAHAKAWWWYLPVLPALLLPWSLWLPLWARREQRPEAVSPWAWRFCVSCCLPALVLFSLTSAKQPHYLLPLFPFLALLMSQRISSYGADLRRHALAPGLLWCILGVLLAAIPYIAAGDFTRLDAPPWVANLSPWMGFPVLLAGLVAIGLRVRSRLAATALVSLLSPVLILSLHLFAMPGAAAAYDVGPISRQLAQQQSAAIPIAIRRKYQGQFQFEGRLEQPLDSLELDELPAWFDAHPNGLFIAIHRFGLPTECQPEFSQLYRGGWIAIWKQSAIAAHPEILEDGPPNPARTLQHSAREFLSHNP